MSTRRGASSARASTLSNKTVSKNAMSRTSARLISGPSTRSSARTRVRSSQWKLNNRVRQAVDCCRVPQPEADQSFIESGSMGWHMPRRITPFCTFSICCSDNRAAALIFGFDASNETYQVFRVSNEIGGLDAALDERLSRTERAIERVPAVHLPSKNTRRLGTIDVAGAQAVVDWPKGQ
jgi:hypothetical protein